MANAIKSFFISFKLLGKFWDRFLPVHFGDKLKSVRVFNIGKLAGQSDKTCCYLALAAPAGAGYALLYSLTKSSVMLAAAAA